MRARGMIAAVLAAAFTLPAGIAAADGRLEAFVEFDPRVPELPEGLAVDKRGDLYVSLVDPVRQIRKIDPDGTQSVLVDFDNLGVEGVGPAGLAMDANGTVYAAVIAGGLEELGSAELDLPPRTGSTGWLATGPPSTSRAPSRSASPTT